MSVLPMRRAFSRRAVVALCATLAGVLAGVPAAHGASGDADRAWSGDGWWSSAGNGELRDLAVDSQGRPLVVLEGHNSSTIFDSDYRVGRLTRAGRWDPSFGNGGTVRADFAGSWDRPARVLAWGTKTVLVGISRIRLPGESVERDRLAVGRLRSDGSWDTGFSGVGRRIVVLPQSVNPQILDARVMADGSVVIVVSTADDWGSFRSAWVVRLRADGALDTRFAGDGIKDFFHRAWMGAFIGAGGSVTSWTLHMSNPVVYRLERRRPSMAMDTRFHHDGIRTIPASEVGDCATGIGLTVDRGARSYISCYDDLHDRVWVSRYTSTGAVDRSFADRGQLRFATPYRRWVLATDPENRLMLSGTNNFTGSVALFRRYTGRGAADTTFSGDGVTQLRVPQVFPGDYWSPLPIRLGPDRIYVPGYVYPAGGSEFSTNGLAVLALRR